MGWMDIARIVDDDSGGIGLGDFFQRSIRRRDPNLPEHKPGVQIHIEI